MTALFKPLLKSGDETGRRAHGESARHAARKDKLRRIQPWQSWLAALAMLIGVPTGPVVLLANPPGPDKENWRGPCYNCYNYAVNRKSVFFAQPPDPPDFDYVKCPDVIAGAISNGLKVAAWPGRPAPPPADWPAGACASNECLVALAVIPPAVVRFKRRYLHETNYIGDFHWYRLNGDGTPAHPYGWSHKPGTTPATCFDQSNRLIDTNNPPHKANLWPYAFCSYMCVPKPPAALPNFTGGSTWTGAELAESWTARGAGREEQRKDRSDVLRTLLQLYPIFLAADPGWLDSEEFRGYMVRFSPLAGPGVAPLLRVHNGIIAAYSDLEGDANTTITYYADSFGLEPFLVSLHGPPSSAAVLAIQPGTNSLVEVVWPVSMSNWVAETTFNLNMPVWFPAGTSREEGDVRVMTQPMSGPQRFYRLRELPPLP